MTYFLRGDPALLQRFRDGDRETLEGVYRAHVDAVARVVGRALRKYGCDEHQREWGKVAIELPDLVQEVFIRAFEPKTRRRFDGSRLYAPYLSQITRNVVVDHLRKRGRENAVGIAAFVDEIGLDRADGRGGDDFADWKTMSLVDRYVAQLPRDLRRVHEALYVQGLSQREASLALGVGRQVVRTLESRLRDGLRLALEEIADSHGGDSLKVSRPRIVASGQKAGGAS